MIKLSGPRVASAGTEVCLNATNVGKGLSVVATVGDKEIPVDVVIDPREDTATICFTLPGAESPGVVVTVRDASGGRGTSHVVFAK